MGTLPQAFNIIFELQRKRNNEKITRREISFPTYKTYIYIILFYFIFPFWTSPTFKSHNFLIHFK